LRASADIGRRPVEAQEPRFKVAAACALARLFPEWDQFRHVLAQRLPAFVVRRQYAGPAGQIPTAISRPQLVEKIRPAAFGIIDDRAENELHGIF